MQHAAGNYVLKVLRNGGFDVSQASSYGLMLVCDYLQIRELAYLKLANGMVWLFDPPAAQWELSDPNFAEELLSELRRFESIRDRLIQELSLLGLRPTHPIVATINLLQIDIGASILRLRPERLEIWLKLTTVSYCVDLRTETGWAQLCEIFPRVVSRKETVV